MWIQNYFKTLASTSTRWHAARRRSPVFRSSRLTASVYSASNCGATDISDTLLPIVFPSISKRLLESLEVVIRLDFDHP